MIRRIPRHRRVLSFNILNLHSPFTAAAESYGHNLVIGAALHKADAAVLLRVSECTMLETFARRGDPRLAKTEAISARRLGTALKRYVAGDCQPRAIPEVEAPLAANINMVASLIGLSDTEAALLRFVITVDESSELRELLDALCMGTLAQVHAAFGVATGCAPADVRAAFAPNGRLLRSGIVSVCEFPELLSGRFDAKEGLVDLLSLPDLSAETFIHTFLPEVPKTGMQLDDFAELQTEVALARTILTTGLARRKTGVNILLYGPTGTGKTTLATVLAREVGARLLLTGGDPNTGGETPTAQQRISSLLLGQRLLGSGADILLFDEVEDLFVWSPESIFGGRGNAKAEMSKQWFNSLLETNPVPTVWITNRVEGIDPAFLRRFTYAIEVRSAGPGQRARVLARHLGEASVLPAEDTDAIARRFDVSPGQFATAVDAARMIAGDGRPNREAIERLLLPIDRLVTGREVVARDAFDAKSFRLDGLRASEDLVRLADRLAARQSPTGLTLLFHGEPGTGKSEYARFLAHRMGRELVYRRASDCIDKYVGESEKLIAAAFKEAEREGAVLVFDEADSFLRARGGAQYSWEVTMVNEFLQQLEAYHGVVVCTTNLLGDLDPAALRRFIMKVGFKFAGRSEAMALFSALLVPLFAEPVAANDEAAFGEFAGKTTQLAAGDFAAVSRRFRALGDPITTRDCIEALSGEVALKKVRSSAGFGQ